MAGAAAPPRLALHGIHKAFGGQPALRGVDLDLADGEVIGLIGENGAGKSTLLNIASGVLPADAGEVFVDGGVVSPQSYQEANQLGIFRIFQEPALVEELAIYENVFFGWERLFRGRTGTLGRSALRRAAAAALTEAGLPDIDIRRPLRELSRSQRQRLDVARVLALADRLEIKRPIVLFDEPTTALDHQNAHAFLELLDQMRGRASVVFVSHRLPEILRTCSRVVVLKDGQRVAERSTADVGEGELHQLMVGRARTANYYREQDQRDVTSSGEGLLHLAEVHVGSVVRGVTLSVKGGEIVGVAGTDGSGKRELGEAIAGVRAVTSGQLGLAGQPLRPGVAAAVKAGVAYIPPDRLASGLIPGASVLWNIQLASLRDRFSTPLGVWRRAAARSAVTHVTTDLSIVTKGIDAEVATLSGGNQQKVLLAKWLIREPQVVVLDNPTQGVDTGARESIYRLLRDLASQGTAVILISDDLPELIGLANRIVVITAGQVAGEYPAPARSKPNEHDIVGRMLRADKPATPTGGDR